MVQQNLPPAPASAFSRGVRECRLVPVKTARDGERPSLAQTSPASWLIRFRRPDQAGGKKERKEGFLSVCPSVTQHTLPVEYAVPLPTVDTVLASDVALRCREEANTSLKDCRLLRGLWIW